MALRIGDLVRITNGAWSNAKKMPHYGKTAKVRSLPDQRRVELEIPLTLDARSYAIETMPRNEVELIDVIQRLADVVK